MYVSLPRRRFLDVTQRSLRDIQKTAARETMCTWEATFSVVLEYFALSKISEESRGTARSLEHLVSEKELPLRTMCMIGFPF